MTKNELLNKALFCSATIHQPHALKAFLAAESLSQSIILDEVIWEQASKLMSNSEVLVSGTFSEFIEAPKLSDIRIQRILERGIYPVAYEALIQWHKNKGFDDIFNHYIKISASHNEYLSHNITILLVFNTLYPQLNKCQKIPFLERMTEFITSTFGSKSVNVHLTQFQAVTFKELLDVSIEQSGFFGHNLITLAWLMRCRGAFDKDLLMALNQHLYIQATSPLEDSDDAVDLEVFSKSVGYESEEYFSQKIHTLVFDTCSNRHQITLADSLEYLWKQFPDNRESISRVTDYYGRMLEK